MDETLATCNGMTNTCIDHICIEDVVCRDYLRNVCTRGSRCKFKHQNIEASRQVLGQQQPSLNFCHDFQNTACNRSSCKFIHGSRYDEEHYRLTGELPKTALNTTVSKVVFQESGNEQLCTSDVGVPFCKDFLKGDCRRGTKCKFRHLDQLKPDGRDQHVEKTEDCEAPEIKRRHLEEAINSNLSPYPSSVRQNPPDLDTSCILDQQPSPPSCHHTYTTLTNQSSQAIHLQPKVITVGSYKHMDYQLLQEENLFMCRRIDELKKQVSDLMATNEFLLEQNAHLRIQGKIPSACSTVTTVTLPAVSIANSMAVPVTTSVQAINLAPIPTVQATTTLPLVTHTAQSASTLNTSIPYAGSVSLTQPAPMATVSIAPVTINQTGGLSAQAPSLSGTSATVTLTPTLSATALQLGPNALSLSGANAASLVSYPIMTQSIITPQTLQNSLSH